MGDPSYWIAIGKTDFLYKADESPSKLLDEKGYKYTYYEFQNEHVWNHWHYLYRNGVRSDVVQIRNLSPQITQIRTQNSKYNILINNLCESVWYIHSLTYLFPPKPKNNTMNRKFMLIRSPLPG